MLKRAHWLGAVAVAPIAYLAMSQWGCQSTCATASDCGAGSYCSTQDDACLTATAVGFCKSIPTSCAEATDPVCGCDGKQYQSSCEAARAGVSVAAAGTCPTSACGGIQALACADPTTYCQFPLGTCTSADPSGTCAAVPASCSTFSSPVCGCDGHTYANACEAAKAKVSVASAGPCSCGGPGGVTCAADEFCSYGTSTTAGSCLTPDSLGSCEPRPTTCVGVISTVCGCDGNTYANPCEAAKAGWAVALTGACPVAGETMDGGADGG